MGRIIEISHFRARNSANAQYSRHAFLDSHVISQKMASLSRLPVQGRDVRVSESNDREVSTNVVVKGAVRTQILRRFVIKSLPTDVPVIL